MVALDSVDGVIYDFPGSVLGPVLWNLVFSDVLVSLSSCPLVKVVACGDDLIVLVLGTCFRVLEVRLGRMVDFENRNTILS